MSNFYPVLESFTRFNATHEASIQVMFQEWPSTMVADDSDYFGLEIFTHNESIANIFGVKPVENWLESASKIRVARRAGHHILYMELVNHSSYAFHLRSTYPQRDWDSSCVGILIVDRTRWLTAMPGKTATLSYVAKILHDRIERPTEAILNGEVYRAEMLVNGSLMDSCDDFLDPDEALSFMKEAYPDIRYTDADFEVKTVFIPKFCTV